MKKLFVWMLCISIAFSCNTAATKDETSSTGDTTSTASGTSGRFRKIEVADEKYIEIGRAGLAALTSGDIDSWMSQYADNAVYQWNSGDSINGKAAIAGYWKKRRSEVIDSVGFSNMIWLPARVLEPQANEEPGVWLLGWYTVNVKYKSGNNMTQSIHTVMHFDANDKIDRVVQYLDRAPINAAVSSKPGK
jgi:ketosteroid isomerase-like protein